MTDHHQQHQQLATSAALANDFEYNLKTFKVGGRYIYQEQINDMMARGTTMFTIEHHHLNDRLALDVLNNPDEALQAAKEAVYSILSEIHHDYAQEIKDKIHVRIAGLDPTPMKEIPPEKFNKLVTVDGRVVGISDTIPVLAKEQYVCANCGTRSENKKPKQCETCGKKQFELDDSGSSFTYQQIIKLMDMDTKGRAVTLSCENRVQDYIWMPKPGEKLRVTGIYRAIPYKEKFELRFIKRLEVNGIEPLQKNEIVVTEQDVKYFKELADQPIFWQILVDSFAPHLHGLEEQKELCIYTLGSCGTRRPFNSLICGRPARGKTELVKFTVAMHQNGTKITIAKASIPGLTSITDIDPDTQTRITKPGLFAMYDGGIVGITELQAIRGKADLKEGMNDALENKEISSAMAGGEVQMPARCAVLFDTNNFMGTWDYHAPLAHNLKFMEPNLHQFLSRIDLVSVTPEKADRELHKQIAYKNFETTSTEEAIEQFKDDWTKEGITYMGTNTLRKYFAYVNSLPLPPLKPELKEAFAENYANVAETEYSVDGRYNRAVKTLAQVRARLLLKDAVDMDDLAIAIEVVNKSKEITTVTEDGEHDANAALGLKSKRQIERELNQEEQFIKAFEKGCRFWKEKGEDGSWCKEDDIIHWLVTDYKWNEDKAARFVPKRLGNANARPLFLENAGKWQKA